MQKGDTVFYKSRAGTVRARVETVHRDGSVTVGALYFVDEKGNDVPGYLGYRYSRLALEGVDLLSDEEVRAILDCKDVGSARYRINAAISKAPTAAA